MTAAVTLFLASFSQRLFKMPRCVSSSSERLAVYSFLLPSAIHPGPSRCLDAAWSPTQLTKNSQNSQARSIFIQSDGSKYSLPWFNVFQHLETFFYQ